MRTTVQIQVSRRQRCRWGWDLFFADQARPVWFKTKALAIAEAVRLLDQMPVRVAPAPPPPPAGTKG